MIVLLSSMLPSDQNNDEATGNIEDDERADDENCENNCVFSWQTTRFFYGFHPSAAATLPVVVIDDERRL